MIPLLSRVRRIGNFNAEDAEDLAEERKDSVPSACTFASSAFNLPPRHGTSKQKSATVLRVLHSANELRQSVLRVAVKHSRDGLEEQRVLEAGKTFALPALQHHY